MELEGHPTEDILEELQRRGALRYSGSKSGPNTTSAGTPKAAEAGSWLFLPKRVYQTGLDHVPE